MLRYFTCAVCIGRIGWTQQRWPSKRRSPWDDSVESVDKDWGAEVVVGGVDLGCRICVKSLKIEGMRGRRLGKGGTWYQMVQWLINFIAHLLSFQHTCQGRMRVLGLRYPDGRTGNKMVGMHRSRGPRPCKNLNKNHYIVFFFAEWLAYILKPAWMTFWWWRSWAILCWTWPRFLFGAGRKSILLDCRLLLRHLLCRIRGQALEVGMVGPVVLQKGW